MRSADAGTRASTYISANVATPQREQGILNTPRPEVLDSARFWIDATARQSRRQPCFAIAKDGKKGDHRGRPASLHYWEITCEQLLLAFEWHLNNNDTFEVQKGDGTLAVVQQCRWLRIGGHLSAAYVELVALPREYQCTWPRMLSAAPTARYRDNLFVVLPEPSEAERSSGGPPCTKTDI